MRSMVPRLVCLLWAMEMGRHWEHAMVLLWESWSVSRLAFLMALPWVLRSATPLVPMSERPLELPRAVRWARMWAVWWAPPSVPQSGTEYSKIDNDRGKQSQKPNYSQCHCTAGRPERQNNWRSGNQSVMHLGLKSVLQWESQLGRLSELQ